MKTRNIIIIGVAILIILGAVAGILLADQFQGDTSYNARLAKAQKYFDAGDYDNAILEYRAAIEMEEADEEAYIGLARLYHSRGLAGLARQTLEKGLLRFIGNEELTDFLTTYFPDEVEMNNHTGEQGDVVTNKSAGTAYPVLNIELLQYLSGASYGDYQLRYSSVKTVMDSGRCVVSIPDIQATALFYDTSTDRVINTATEKPYSEFLPNEIQLDDVMILFGGVTQIDYSTLHGLPGIDRVDKKDGIVQFEACRCRVEISCDENGTVSRDASNKIYPMRTVTSTYRTLYGNVIDATSGKEISGVSVKVYPGISMLETPYEFETDVYGHYEIQAEESGNFTVLVSKQGYIEESFSIYIPEASTEMKYDITISPQMEESVIRIVLTWGATPHDLDSYLIGLSSDGSYTEVAFYRPVAYDRNNDLIADLDVDDTSSYGPETITLYDINGVYEYSVVDYTGSNGVGTSGATIKIYKGNQLLETVTPGSEIGLGWRVFRIDHGEIYVLNEECPVVDGILKN